MAASGAAFDASRSRETSTPRVVCALPLLPLAELVEGSAARLHQMPWRVVIARDEHTM